MMRAILTLRYDRRMYFDRVEELIRSVPVKERETLLEELEEFRALGASCVSPCTS